MKRFGVVLHSILAVLSLVFLTGCLTKSTPVPIRYFVLTPISTNQPASLPAEQLSVEIGFVKMPPYLLRDSLAIRIGADEIKFLEESLWAERLDRGFQRILAANISGLLPSDKIHVADWGNDEVQARVHIDVQQFDVDTHGQGTLIVQWRITAPVRDAVLKTQHIRLDRAGASPRGNPQAIATTLSDLLAEFSREVAKSIRESVKSGAVR